MPSSSVSLNSPPTHALYDMELPATSHPSLYHVPYDSPVAASPHLVGTVRPKRKQVKNACSACQRACKRCDVGRPCERCIKYGMADTCRDSQRKERKKGVKRGPYKKRDGMLNDLQRMASPKRMSRVSSISDIDLSSANLIPIDQPVMPLQQSTSYYQSMPAQTPPQSFASMHSPSHATFHQSEEYYTRYDHLQQANARPQYPSTSQDYRQDRSPMRLQYPSPDNSPGRERQYSGPAYADNSSHRHMIQSVHHDVSYQSQSDGHEYETSAVRNVEQYYPQHQQQSHQGQQHQAQPQHQVQAQLQQHQVQHQVQHQAQHQPQHQVHQAQHQRSYSDGHMADVHQEQYYSGYNSYSQSSSYDNSYYPQQSQHQHQSQHQSQQHQQHQQSYQHHTGEQNDAYMNRMVPDHYSSAPSINSYPTHHQMNGTIPMQYSSVRTQGKMVHRDDMVAQHQYHQSHHASNVQIQSN